MYQTLKQKKYDVDYESQILKLSSVLGAGKNLDIKKPRMNRGFSEDLRILVI